MRHILLGYTFGAYCYGGWLVCMSLNTRDPNHCPRNFGLTQSCLSSFTSTYYTIIALHDLPYELRAVVDLGGYRQCHPRTINKTFFHTHNIYQILIRVNQIHLKGLNHNFNSQKKLLLLMISSPRAHAIPPTKFQFSAELFFYLFNNKISIIYMNVSLFSNQAVICYK